ncbi:PHP domain-containing protein [Vallicoccus soli]|uniref:Histidinol-phosphatase n=1 Tax=Vallicoccus soli TaxID=2339232 RepID=A0A3A3Z275_9ACTN|nr:PHP domain-containing protein [Vallicoccus soli]RJK96834.1 histidinol-phosphatase [Vallicoccus soli]
MPHGHEHDHDHHHEHHHHGAGQGAPDWADPADDRPLSVSRRRFLAGVGATGAAAVVAGPGAAAPASAAEAQVRTTNAWGPRRYLAGDHHIHTTYSPDAMYEVATQVAQARRYGLDWVVMTDHGGVAHQKLSIDQITPEIEAARRAFKDVLVYQGLEWNIPGAEHATVFLPPGRRTVEVLKAFEGAYDGGILADTGVIARSTSSEGEPYALEALRFLEAQVLSGRVPIALMLANHPARRGIDSPHELRGWRDSAPGVAIGMEGAPGHQAAGIPVEQGGLGDDRGYYGGAPSPDSFPGYDPTEDENPYRTYGGFDWMTAKLGGVWDSLLAEGRGWWVTATSDSHQVHLDTRVQGPLDFEQYGQKGAPVETGTPQVRGDFWPGFYSSTVVGSRSRAYVDLMRGLQAGEVLAVHGRVIDGLDLRVRSLGEGDRRGVTLGGRTYVRRGDDVEVTATVHLAGGPNFSGEIPRLAKVDLIAGPVTGPAVDRDTMTAPGTQLVDTFEVPSRRRGTFRVKYVFRDVDGPFYLRLRGSDGNRLTADGGPVQDVPGDADPWSDLWFYANPVFVDVL